MIATLQPISGWRLLSMAEQARFISEELGENGYRTILAVAVPESRNDNRVFALLEHQSVGYVANPSAGDIDLAYVRQQALDDLKILNNENDLPVSEQVRWGGFSPKPAYNAQEYSLDYGVKLIFGEEAALNLYRIQLVRDGAVVLMLVGSPGDDLTLEGWQIQPSAEWNYNRYVSGQDRLSESTLENLMLMNRFI